MKYLLHSAFVRSNSCRWFGEDSTDRGVVEDGTAAIVEHEA